MATFLFECQFSVTFECLCDHKDVDRRMIDEYQKYDDYSPLAWEEFEEAFNSVAKELFVPKQKEFKMQTYDDKVCPPC
jgi:hypothetical protein